MLNKRISNYFNQLNLDNHHFKDYIIPFVVFCIFTFASILFFNHFQDQAIWGNMKAAGGNAFKFCEHNNMGTSLVQTSNTWSNLGFLLTGLIMLFMGIKDTKLKEENKTNLLLKYPVFSIIIGISILYLFVGSFFYHASVTYFFQMIDQTGMYAILLGFMAYNVFRIWPSFKDKTGKTKSSHHWIIFGLLIFDILFLTVLWKIIDINILFTSLALSFIAFSVVYTKKTKAEKFTKVLLYAAVIVYLTSMSIWIMDRSNIFCDPQSLFQGHALWHLLNAVALMLIYFSYRSEHNIISK
ncbi:MAG: ceramidase domain-containing protein [Chitinophagales bacterium]